MSNLAKTYSSLAEWKKDIQKFFPGAKVWQNNPSGDRPGEPGQWNAQVGSKLVGTFSRNGVIRVQDKEQQWTGTYSATTRLNKRISFTATMSAPDRYIAGDKLKAMASRTYGSDLYNIVIQFGPQRMQQGSISNKVAAMAGEAEDSRRKTMAKDHHIYIHLPRRQGKTAARDSQFKKSDRVTAKVSAQGMTKGMQYVITDIDVQSAGGFGDVVTYQLNGNMWISNGAFLLTKDARSVAELKLERQQLQSEAEALKPKWQELSKKIDEQVRKGASVKEGDPLTLQYSRIKGKYDSILRRIKSMSIIDSSMEIYNRAAWTHSVVKRYNVGSDKVVFTMSQNGDTTATFRGKKVGQWIVTGTNSPDIGRGTIDEQSRASNGEFGKGGGSNEGTPRKGDDPKTAKQRQEVAAQAKRLSNTPQAKAHQAKQEAVASKLKNGGSLNAREEHNLSRMRQGTSLAGKTSKQHPPSKSEIEGLYSGRE